MDCRQPTITNSTQFRDTISLLLALLKNTNLHKIEISNALDHIIESGVQIDLTTMATNKWEKKFHLHQQLLRMWPFCRIGTCVVFV